MTPAPYRQRVIPVGAYIAAVVAFGLLFPILATLVTRHASREAQVIFPTLVSLAVAGNILLIGYVYGDARRRGMRYVMWTLLAIFLFNGIGIILYFILREPLLGYCSKCGSAVNHGFAFCPRCGVGVQPACPSCHRVIQGPWAHCAWCGVKVA
jgi:RNA polymerase subunit RPABC4/transcription elongation factor Spt4